MKRGFLNQGPGETHPKIIEREAGEDVEEVRRGSWLPPEAADKQPVMQILLEGSSVASSQVGAQVHHVALEVRVEDVGPEGDVGGARRCSDVEEVDVQLAAATLQITLVGGAGGHGLGITSLAVPLELVPPPLGHLMAGKAASKAASERMNLFAHRVCKEGRWRGKHAGVRMSVETDARLVKEGDAACAPLQPGHPATHQ